MGFRSTTFTGDFPWPALIVSQAQSVEFEAIRCVVRTMPEGAGHRQVVEDNSNN